MFYAEWSKTNLMSQKDEDFTLRQRERQKREKDLKKNNSWHVSPLLPLSTQSKACDKQQFQARRMLHKIWLQCIWPSCHRDKKMNRTEGTMNRTAGVPNFTIRRQAQAF